MRTSDLRAAGKIRVHLTLSNTYSSIADSSGLRFFIERRVLMTLQSSSSAATAASLASPLFIIAWIASGSSSFSKASFQVDVQPSAGIVMDREGEDRTHGDL